MFAQLDWMFNGVFNCAYKEAWAIEEFGFK